MQTSIYNYKKPILAGAIGNFIEVYDYSHYMYFAPIFAAAFFPQNNSATGLIFTLCIYAIERLIRPIAGIFVGRYVDTHGRSKTLFFSVIGMVIAGFLMCILPTYQTIGMAAPILLLLVRTLQGIFMSSEFATSMVYIYEHAPDTKKGVLGSIAFLSGTFGSILSSGLSFLIIYYFSREFVVQWGWRIPYLIGMVILILGYQLRKNLLETPSFISRETEIVKVSFAEVLRNNTKPLLLCFVLTALSATTYTIFLVYMPSHLSAIKQLSLSLTVGLTALNLMFYACILPLMGYLSDKIGQYKLILISTCAICVFSYPAYYLLNMATTLIQIEAVMMFCLILIAGLNGPMTAYVSSLFPVSSRVTSLAFGYGVSLSLFGGIAPLVCIYLSKLTVNASAPGVYMMICALFAIYFLRAVPKPMKEADLKYAEA